MANERDYGLVIGVKHYKNMTPLEGPHADANDFLKWLTDADGGDIPHANTRTFLSADTYTPTQDEIDEWLDSTFNTFSQSGSRGKRLFFYFSGHGIGVSAMNSAMLLPKWTYSMRNYALSSEKYLLELVNKGIFEQIFFFMDCCRNRIAGVQGQSPFWANASPSPASSEYLLYYASEFENPAFESIDPSLKKLDNTLPRGLFTNVLLNGLRGAASDKEGRLKIQNLINYVKRKLPELAESVGRTQIPRPRIEIDLDKEISGPFPRIVNITISFTVAGLEMILEDPELNQIKSGNSSDGKWDLSLLRGQYLLRKKEDINGMRISVDGLKTDFIYE